MPKPENPIEEQTSLDEARESFLASCVGIPRALALRDWRRQQKAQKWSSEAWVTKGRPPGSNMMKDLVEG